MPVVSSSRLRRAAPALALSVLVFGASCYQGPRAPQIAAQRTLGLGGEGGEKGSTKPFGVVFGGPRGPLTEASEVTVVFNRPMRALSLAGEEARPPLTLDPMPKGSFRWMGTSALSFIPDPALPRATAFSVKVPAGTSALDGSKIEKDYTFDFQTPRPKVVRVHPGEGQDHLTPHATFELWTNQPVDTKGVLAGLKLLVHDGKTPRVLPYTVAFPKADVPTRFVVTPSKALPLATPVELVVEGLRGLEGPLPSEGRNVTSMRTYGPLVANELGCSVSPLNRRCSARGGFWFSLSNRVKEAELRAHVRVDGDAKLVWPKVTDSGAPGLSSHFSLPIRTSAAKSFRVTVTAGLKDEYGQVLAKDRTYPVQTDDEMPNVEIGVDGGVLEATRQDPKGHTREIPVGATNVSDYELVATPLAEEEIVTLAAVKGPYEKRFEYVAGLAKAKRRVVRPQAEKNTTATEWISLDQALAGRGRGSVAIGVKRVDGPRKNIDVHVIQVTDLAVSARLSRFGSVVWVTRLSDGKPVPGATVAARDKSGKELFTCATDPNGLCAIAREKWSPSLNESGEPGDTLFARLGNDVTHRRVADILSPWRQAHPVDLQGGLEPYGMLFTDRGIYKTGETIHVKGLFREPLARGTQVPKGRSVEVAAFDRDGTELLKKSVSLGAFGEMTFDVAIPTTGKLGSVDIRADVKGEGGEGHASAQVDVAAYRPSEIAAHVEAEKPSYVRGDKAAFVTRGDYLFGAPMTAGKVRTSVRYGRGFYAISGLENVELTDDPYVSSLPEAEHRAGSLVSNELPLDGKGQARTDVPLVFAKQSGPLVVTAESEVEDVSRQTVAAQASAIVHPGEFYVASVYPKDFFVKAGAPFKAEAICAAPDGKRRPGAKVHFEAIRRTWHTIVEESGEDGLHYESRPVDKVLAKCDATSSVTGSAACDLPLADPGYLVVRATSEDGRKNPLASSVSFYVTGEAADLAWQRTDASTLELVTDKKSYEVGDTAKILVKNPFREAEALVTIERAGIYKQDRVKLSGPMPTLDVKITDDFRPNAYVSVALVRGRVPEPKSEKKGEAHGDVGAPAYSVGTTSLEVNRESRRLKVDLATKKKSYGPGEEVEVDLVVKDQKGKASRADVAFYAVDEGVLMLTGYKTPDPIPTFTAPRPLAVAGLETREDMARVRRFGRAPGEDKGDEGGGGGSSARQDFRSTAVFVPSIVTDAEGRGKAKFKLPDSLTTYRLMAVASSEDDRFGYAEQQITTSRPLMARPALPRFFRAGDKVEAGVVVSTKGIAAGTFEVTLEATNVKVEGETTKTVTVPAGGSVEVRFAMATPNAGPAKLAFHAKSQGGQGLKDDVIVSREIMVPLVPEAVALYGETTQSVAERLGDLGNARQDVGGLDLRLASTALVGLDDGVEALLNYPYGCTEQLTSRTIPLVALVDLAHDYNVVLPNDPGKKADEALRKILENQRNDGGFGYWSDSQVSDPWLSAYALFGLAMAKERGRFVPPDALASGTRYLRAELAKKNTQSVHLATSAFVLDVLTVLGSPDPGYMSKLFEQRKSLPIFARALLAHAMAKTQPKEAAELLVDLETHLRVTPTGATVTENLGDEYAPLLDSEARTTALVLRALVTTDPKHAMAARIAKGLLAMRNHGAWRSTQENAWALLSLDAYRKAQEADPPSFDVNVFVGDAHVFDAEFRGRSVKAKTATFGMPKLFESGAAGQNLAFQVNGTGKLFYEARLRYSRKDLPQTGLDRGFFVRKIVRSVRPEGLSDALRSLPTTSSEKANGGDLVLVDLLVVTPDPREHVVVDDPLPAGLEAVQANLSTTARSLSVTEPGGQGDDEDDERSSDDAVANGRGTAWAPYHREMRDDRVLTFVEHMPAGLYHYRYLARATTFGTYVVPPARAECMYEPETFGRTGATSFTVSDK